MQILENGLSEVLWRTMIGGTVADQRGDQSCCVKGLETLRTLIEMLPEDLTLLLAETLVE
jgi:hypothetical protein